MDGISKEAYLKAKPQHVQLEMIFDIVTAVNLKVEENGENIRSLEKCFQARKIRDRTFSGFTGFVGGFIASFARGIFK